MCNLKMNAIHLQNLLDKYTELYSSLGKKCKRQTMKHITLIIIYCLLQLHHIESLSKTRKKKVLPDLFCKITTPCLLVLVILYMTYSGTICVGCKTSSKDWRPKMVCKLWGGKEQMLSERFASNE